MLFETILGGVTGLLGTAITSVINFKTQKMKNSHEIELIKVQTDAMKIEAEMNIQIKRAEIEGAVELADSQAYIESQKTGNEAMFSEKWIGYLFGVEGRIRYLAFPAAIILAMGFGLVDWMRGAMRPVLTIYLTVMTTVVTIMAWNIMQQHGLEGMSVSEALGIFKDVINIIIYLTVSTVTWWFGDRSTAKYIIGMKDKK